MDFFLSRAFVLCTISALRAAAGRLYEYDIYEYEESISLAVGCYLWLYIYEYYYNTTTVVLSFQQSMIHTHT